MKGVIIHGGLLAVMLFYGYQTWTRDKSTTSATSAKSTAGQVVMWTRDVAHVQTVELQDKDRTLRIERRGEGAGAYWWGIETKTTRRFKPVLPPADPTAPPPAPEEEIATDSHEFPIGDTGAKLIGDLAKMRAVKAVGTIKDEAKKDYGLEEATKTLAVVFPDGSKTLVLGGSVFGGSDRYVMDVDTSKVFVVSRNLVVPLEGGENSLKPVDLRSFEPKEAKQIAIAGAGKTKTVDRIKVKKPADAADPHAPPTGKPADEMIEAWGTGAVADQTAANFIDKIEKLRPSRFESKVDAATLQPVIELTYRDAKGKQLGTIKLMRRQRPDEPATVPADPDPGPVQYYLITERTRVPARVPAMAAERVEQDIETVFAPPAPSAPPGAGSGAGSAVAPTGTGTGTGTGSAVAPPPVAPAPHVH